MNQHYQPLRHPKCFSGEFVDIFNTDKKYTLIYADPPWKLNSIKTGGSMKSGAANQYPTMDLYQLMCLPVRYMLKPDAVLVMWYLSSMPDEALQLAKAWGFKKFSNINGIVWEKLTKNGKTNFGMGAHTRAGTESALIAYNGSRERLIRDKGVSNLIKAPMPINPETREYIHSAKPPEAYERIDRLYGKHIERIELFSRKRRIGWDCWGNEVKEEYT
ncbi:MT-A70 family methyltransferase [Vibrio salinus]|uniref:MT-A70 family methyltransferase n=1 Tax=Vibrio salinus TaxID=2899784 RepID=UPI001E5B057D|nr:MT-A70 family methyltransferase [Vibrio salinus]MCE0495738.1 hypothetical protein [Vibrio salinus]